MRARFPLGCFLLLAGALTLCADEQVRRVQEELRKRNLFFGDVDGRDTAEIRGAIRRYQERKGFGVSGDLSNETLQSLDIAPGKNAEENWPEGTIMKSDAARQLSETDREALEQAAKQAFTAVGVPAATPTPISSDAPAPEPNLPLDEVALGPNPPAAPPSEEAAREARKFVEDYLAACVTNRLQSELDFYADRMSYFDHGTVDREFVARDVERFYRRWPQRKYELLDFKLGRAKGDDLEVTFKIAFNYKNPTQSVAGRSMNFFKLRRGADGLRFTSLKESRLRQ